MGAKIAPMPRLVSIHAPARGATNVLDMGFITLTVSIHAPARGATGQMYSNLKNIQFQFTRPRGARQWVFYHIVFVRC